MAFHKGSCSCNCQPWGCSLKEGRVAPAAVCGSGSLLRLPSCRGLRWRLRSCSWPHPLLSMVLSVHRLQASSVLLSIIWRDVCAGLCSLSDALAASLAKAESLGIFWASAHHIGLRMANRCLPHRHIRGVEAQRCPFL